MNSIFLRIINKLYFYSAVSSRKRIDEQKDLDGDQIQILFC